MKFSWEKVLFHTGMAVGALCLGVGLARGDYGLGALGVGCGLISMVSRMTAHLHILIVCQRNLQTLLFGGENESSDSKFKRFLSNAGWIHGYLTLEDTVKRLTAIGVTTETILQIKEGVYAVYTATTKSILTEKKLDA